MSFSMPPKKKSPPRSEKSRLVSSESRKLIATIYKITKSNLEKSGQRLSETSIIHDVALLCDRNFHTVRDIVKNVQQGKALLSPNRKRKRNRPVTNVDNFTKEAIERYIYNKSNEGQVVTAANIMQHMRENHETYLFEGSLTSLKIILKEIGFAWSKGDKYARVRESQEIILKRIRFLRAYMENMNSSEPKKVIFLDETWVYMNGSSTYSWQKPGSVEGVKRPTAEGQRIVILHAGSKEGFVPGADLIFASNLKTGQDYHGAMNANTFQCWIQKQLIPGLREMGPCLIVMDNASYHSKEEEKQPTTKWRKDHLLLWLAQNGVQPPPQSTKVELLDLCSLYKSRMKKYVIDELLLAEGHTVLRLPPYHCIFNAIELVWSVSKAHYNKYINAKEGYGKGIQRAQAVWKEALQQVTPEKWRNCVDHTEKVICQYFDKEVRREETFNEIEINVSDESDDSEMEEDDQPLALPLQPIAGPSSAD